MVRRFEQRPVPHETIDRSSTRDDALPRPGSRKGSSSSSSTRPDAIATFWEMTRDPEFGWEEETVTHGPTVLILPLPDARRYLDRYAQPDKIDFGMDEEANWPVRFWEIDAAMASMLILMAAVDEGLGGWFFGITHGERELLDRFGVPGDLRPIGIIGLGYRAADEEPSGSWMRRRRRPLQEQIHRNGW